MNYTPFFRFIFRTPFLPYNRLASILSSKSSLLEKCKEPEVQEAIFIASPVLYDEIQKLLKGEITKEKEVDRIIYSLTRYISRMSTRCTPFGLFAGCSTGEIKDETIIELNESFKRATRLDMFFLCALYDKLLTIPEVKKQTKYYPNSSLYPVGNRLRYIEYQYIEAKRKYQVTEVDNSIYLKKVLTKASGGEYVNELAEILVDNEISIEEANEFINEIVDSQILIGELSQTVTGEDLLKRIIAILSPIKDCENLYKSLKEIEYLFSNQDSENKGVQLYEEIIEKVDLLNIPYEKKYLFQLDLARETSISNLGEDVIKELKSAISFLNKITPHNKNSNLIQFQQDFYSRYEDREMPLMEVLDPDLGIGYPSKSSNGDISPLIDNFALPQQMTQATAINKSYFHSLLLKKTITCLANSEDEIIFTDEDIKDFQENWSDLPLTFQVMFNFIKSEKGNLRIRLLSVGGSSAANLLARFSHTDSEIEELVKDITTKEQELASNSILAEIVHLPEARIGNVLFRPHIREYEMLYLGSSDLPKEKLISMSDLLLSVKNGRLQLRSRMLNKIIIPRLTNAHNYSFKSMPVYRFLCDMQHQGYRGGLIFSWGNFENEFEFKPRVRYKNTILSSASWTIKVSDISILFKINDDKELLQKIQNWREKISLPRYVQMPDGDNELFVDWENTMSVRSLFSIIKNRKIITLNEFLFSTNNAAIKKGTNYFSNEFIVTFHKS